MKLGTFRVEAARGGFVGFRIKDGLYDTSLEYLTKDGWSLRPQLYSSRGQLLHKLSEIMRDTGIDFNTRSPLPGGVFLGQRPRPRSKPRRKYGFYRIHKESLERSKKSS